MNPVSVKQARQKFAQLVDRARQGSAVVITRRGRKVAILGPVTAERRGHLPDLTAFRASLGKARRGETALEKLRKGQRY
jgi:prevent-host-death family protein